MTVWLWLGLACLACYGLKLAGYAVPAAWVEHPVVARATAAMTVGLLAALVVSNTAGPGPTLVVEARLAAAAAAVVALVLRAPFPVVVVVGAVTAAVVRLLGWG